MMKKKKLNNQIRHIRRHIREIRIKRRSTKDTKEAQSNTKI
jgi:hypothetical protein